MYPITATVKGKLNFLTGVDIGRVSQRSQMMVLVSVCTKLSVVVSKNAGPV